MPFGRAGNPTMLGNDYVFAELAIGHVYPAACASRLGHMGQDVFEYLARVEVVDPLLPHTVVTRLDLGGDLLPLRQEIVEASVDDLPTHSSGLEKTSDGIRTRH
jgi:hypothetical protein